jgi:FtsZ-binding cell division protein ZapB
MKNIIFDKAAELTQSSINSITEMQASIRVLKNMGHNTTAQENEFITAKNKLKMQISALEQEGYTFDKKGITF